jgi:hypothetical protein
MPSPSTTVAPRFEVPALKFGASAMAVASPYCVQQGVELWMP